MSKKSPSHRWHFIRSLHMLVCSSLNRLFVELHLYDSSLAIAILCLHQDLLATRPSNAVASAVIPSRTNLACAVDAGPKCGVPNWRPWPLYADAACFPDSVLETFANFMYNPSVCIFVVHEVSFSLVRAFGDPLIWVACIPS